MKNNRIIKFKAWHTKLNQMFSASEMTKDQMALLPDGHFANINSIDTRMSQIFSNDVMIPLQFTGIHDKNGKEIYEKDLLGPEKSLNPKNAWVVNWNDKGYWQANYTKWEAQQSLFDMIEKYNSVIIGNIYENPELLNEDVGMAGRE